MGEGIQLAVFSLTLSRQTVHSPDLCALLLVINKYDILTILSHLGIPGLSTRLRLFRPHVDDFDPAPFGD